MPVRLGGWALVPAMVGFVAGLTLGGCAPGDPSPSTDPLAPGASTSPDVADSVTGADPPTFRLLISEEERERLVVQATSDLESARTIAGERPIESELQPEQRQRWESLDHYIELAQGFLDDGDVRAAADVALKARLLAEDLDTD